MSVNCVRWEDRPSKEACEGWEQDSRPTQDFCPTHDLPGCEDWVDIDISLTADVVFIEADEENHGVTSEETAVIRTNPSGRVPR